MSMAWKVFRSAPTTATVTGHVSDSLRPAHQGARGYARRLLDFKLQADDALRRQISKRAGHLSIDDMPPKVWVNRILKECAQTR
jgi:hypothetical protein